MGFLNPYMFALITLIGLFVLFYFFRKQYEKKVIPSNMIWIQVMKEREASRFFQKWQNHLLFWLQLLSLLFLMFALMRPYLTVEREKGEEFIFIVDTSATMLANHGSKTVFDRHKEEMLSILDQLHEQEVTIITAGSNPEIQLWKESDRKKIKDAIEGLSVTYEHENIAQALRLARAMLANEKGAIHLFSDGVKWEEVTKIINDRYVVVHNSQEDVINVSLRSFVVGSMFDKVKGIAVLKNDSDVKREATFSVKGEKGILFQKTVVLSPDSEMLIPIDSLPKQSFYYGIVDVEDEYVPDNFSTALFHQNTQPVYVHGNISPFFVRGLESIGVDVYHLDDQQTAPHEKGIVATDLSSIEDDYGIGYFLFESTTENLEPVLGSIKQVDDPLLNYVDMRNVHISKSRSSSPFNELESIVSVGDRPLIQKGMLDGIPTVAFLFPIEQTDWPMHPNFPIFLYNSYEWLVQQSKPMEYFQPGEKKWLNFESELVEVFSIDGKNLYTVQTNREAFQAPFEPGIYQAISGHQIYYFSVLIDEQEKKVSSEKSFTLNDSLLDGTTGEKQQVGTNSLWFPLALFALLILFVEWEVFRRNA
ncbi:vWA domain-containing protein [Fervidibacillus halotolerans]|uniref:BatA and WFA domain-containing protein n=1 Tax=Fervidibacillus halotolerans TaxID=2980027 RepID=A0A9E8M3A8_9BACI|nr:BatA and WFA domain-containing protein [Fervidibacillus halotolerans]WAA13629.1 BatA and WFA domain-containing protein [Fervidibacillus halotolerans]